VNTAASLLLSIFSHPGRDCILHGKLRVLPKYASPIRTRLGQQCMGHPHMFGAAMQGVGSMMDMDIVLSKDPLDSILMTTNIPSRRRCAGLENSQDSKYVRC